MVTDCNVGRFLYCTYCTVCDNLLCMKLMYELVYELVYELCFVCKQETVERYLSEKMFTKYQLCLLRTNACCNGWLSG